MKNVQGNTEGNKKSGTQDLHKSERNVSPGEKLRLFKGVVKSLMNDADKVLAEMVLDSTSPEIEEHIHHLGHIVDHTQRLCEDKEISDS